MNQEIIIAKFANFAIVVPAAGFTESPDLQFLDAHWGLNP
jgi:hypothetical protein